MMSEMSFFFVVSYLFFMGILYIRCTGKKCRTVIYTCQLCCISMRIDTLIFNLSFSLSLSLLGIIFSVLRHSSTSLPMMSKLSRHASRVNFHGIGFDFTLLLPPFKVGFSTNGSKKQKESRRAQPNSILLPSPAFLCSYYYDFGTIPPKVVGYFMAKVSTNRIPKYDTRKAILI